MTMHEEWTDRLSEYLDGELPADEAAAVEGHLQGCEACTAVLNDLRRVVARARAAAADARPPVTDLWSGIAEHIDAAASQNGSAHSSSAGHVAAFQRRERRRVTFTLPQLAAAAVVLAAVSGGVAWQLRPMTGAPGSPVAPRSATVERATVPAPAGGGVDSARPFTGGDTADGADAQFSTVGLADPQYDAAVTDLEKALRAGRGKLDASTVSIVEHNLQIIDQAINQAREALVGDPANTYLSSHLVEARRRKLDLLRRAAALTTDMD